MEIRQGLCAAYFFRSFPVGFFLGGVYDLFRILRRARKSGGFTDAALAFFEDLLFALFAGCVLTLEAYLFNSGRVRFITFAADLAGFMLWRLFPGRLVMRCTDAILSAVRNAAERICRPFRRAAALRRTAKQMKEGLRLAAGKEEGGPHAGKRKNVVLRETHRGSVRHRMHHHDRTSADGIQRS